MTSTPQVHRDLNEIADCQLAQTTSDVVRTGVFDHPWVASEWRNAIARRTDQARFRRSRSADRLRRRCFSRVRRSRQLARVKTIVGPIVENTRVEVSLP